MNLATVALIEAESSELVMIHLCPLCRAEARQVRLVSIASGFAIVGYHVANFSPDALLWPT
jgi:hypothetical protein